MIFRIFHLSQHVALTLCVASCCLVTGSQIQLRAQTERTSSEFTFQQSFSSPQKAVDALVAAAENYDVSTLLQIFGPGGKNFIISADPVRDKSLASQFASKAEEKRLVVFDQKTGSRAVLLVGKDRWPFPVPIVKNRGKWYFDSEQGSHEILLRRIGTNELDAIEICRGFVEAQKEYASQVHDDSGVNQYAQKMISTPGKHDGLYWENQDGTPGGPLGHAVAEAIREGYSAESPSGYHGYYFTVLKGQGPRAPLGQLDYVIEGAMVGGFALLAVPVEYRVTGVETFMVSYDGVVYEKDLGSDTLNIAKTIDRYNPDKSWRRSDDDWPDDKEAQAPAN